MKQHSNNAAKLKTCKPVRKSIRIRNYITSHSLIKTEPNLLAKTTIQTFKSNKIKSPRKNNKIKKVETKIPLRRSSRKKISSGSLLKSFPFQISKPTSQKPQLKRIKTHSQPIRTSQKNKKKNSVKDLYSVRLKSETKTTQTGVQELNTIKTTEPKTI